MPSTSHPRHGADFLLPDAFIPLTEETGLAPSIGEWVIDQVCREAATWPIDAGGMLPVALNIYPRQFKAGNLVHIVRRSLAARGLDPARRHRPCITYGAFL
jgi:EAL domain-containing protein (putative c-di-GMP-specific phosphodiesterase class I)